MAPEEGKRQPYENGCYRCAKGGQGERDGAAHVGQLTQDGCPAQEEIGQDGADDAPTLLAAEAGCLISVVSPEL